MSAPPICGVHRCSREAVTPGLCDAHAYKETLAVNEMHANAKRLQAQVTSLERELAALRSVVVEFKRLGTPWCEWCEGACRGIAADCVSRTAIRASPSPSAGAVPAVWAVQTGHDAWSVRAGDVSLADGISEYDAKGRR